MALQLTEISTCWEQVRPQLEIVKAKTDADWSLADVYRLCEAGKWLLFTDQATDSFAMAAVYDSQFSGQRRLEITAAYSGGAGDIMNYLPFWHILAARMGAAVIEVRSPRRGWEKKGFKPVDITYRMEVQNVV